MTPGLTFSYRWIRSVLMMSDDDYRQQVDVPYEIQWVRDLVHAPEEIWEAWCDEHGLDTTIGYWRMDVRYHRERERTQSMRPAPAPKQPSLFDHEPTLGAGVYFHSDGTAIKIGRTAVSERSRRRSHQTGNPRELILLAWIPGASEDAVMEMFDHLHVRGEWYCMDQELLDFIRAWQLVERVFE